MRHGTALFFLTCGTITGQGPAVTHVELSHSPTRPCPVPCRFTGGAERRGTARLLLGLGLAPGSKQCSGLLERINCQEGFMATDVSDIDLAQVRRAGLGAGLVPISESLGGVAQVVWATHGLCR